MHPTGMHSCYRLQRSCGQGNIFTPACHSVHRGGVSASVHAGIPPPRSRHPLAGRHPPGADPPKADTPPEQAHTPQSRHPPGSRHPWSRHPCSRHPPPEADTPQEQTPPPGSRRRHTVNERPVRILLECILVINKITPCKRNQVYYKILKLETTIRNLSVKEALADVNDSYKLKVAEFPKLVLKHGILLNLPL